VLSAPEPRVAVERRGIGLVFQHLELWPHMTVAENIAFGLPGRPRGRVARDHPRVKDLASRVGISELLGRAPTTLSGGERQRVAIARTLAPGPQVTLYDEPLANLDPLRRANLRRLIRELCREEGSTLLYVTHDAEEAMAVGDEIAVLDRGRVVDRGVPERLYRRPRTVAGARALGPVTVLPARVAAGRAETALGAHEVLGDEPAGRALALIRPECLRVGTSPGADAEVVECRPLAQAWRVRAKVGEVLVEGWSPDAVQAGGRVALEVEGPVVLVGEEDS
jgi:iron(III) transport system ATP-binding protein